MSVFIVWFLELGWWLLVLPSALQGGRCPGLSPFFHILPPSIFVRGFEANVRDLRNYDSSTSTSGLGTFSSSFALWQKRGNKSTSSSVSDLASSSAPAHHVPLTYFRPFRSVDWLADSSSSEPKRSNPLTARKSGGGAELTLEVVDSEERQHFSRMFRMIKNALEDVLLEQNHKWQSFVNELEITFPVRLQLSHVPWELHRLPLHHGNTHDSARASRTTDCLRNQMSSLSPECSGSIQHTANLVAFLQSFASHPILSSHLQNLQASFSDFFKDDDDNYGNTEIDDDKGDLDLESVGESFAPSSPQAAAASASIFSDFTAEEEEEEEEKKKEKRKKKKGEMDLFVVKMNEERMRLTEYAFFSVIGIVIIILAYLWWQKTRDASR